MIFDLSIPYDAAIYLHNYVYEAALCKLATEQSQQDPLPENSARLHAAVQYISNKRNLECILGLGPGLVVTHRAQVELQEFVSGVEDSKGASRYAGHYTGPEIAPGDLQRLILGDERTQYNL